MLTVKFRGNGATSGKMPSVKFDGNSGKLPKNVFKRDGFKFVGWSLVKNDKITMKKLQLGKVKYKDKSKISGKDGQVITLYACWKGTGPEAAAKWARLIAKDNTFHYGVGRRAHHNGCYFCGTTRTGPKKAAKGSKWEKTYCCIPFVFACYTHGANMFKRCRNSSLQPSWWKKLGFKEIGRNIPSDQLKAGDLLLKTGRHIAICVGRNKKGKMQIAHAAGEGWGDKSIRVQNVKKTVGSQYLVLRLKK